MTHAQVRTRIAPSPTGYPHIGTVYQALFDFSFARKHNGKFLVRIEDTDQERFVEGAEEKIYQALDWFGLSEDESPRKKGEFSPYKQSERLEIYQKYAKELLEKDHAYYCFCSKERLDEMRKKLQAEKKLLMYDKHCRTLSKEEAQKRVNSSEKWVIRLKVPENETITFEDVARGKISFESSSVDDQVLLKSDGFPTYHLAVVVDDHLMEITHLVRGEEWITSTPKHILLYRFFAWETPLFFHTPVLRNPDKSKLSKRHGHTNVSWYQEQGYLSEAILNFLSLMGWSHPEGKEIFSLKEFIDLFDLKDVKPVGPTFDLTKLTWMNQQYIQGLSNDDLLKKLEDFYSADEEMKPYFSNTITMPLFVGLAKTRMKTLAEFKDLIKEVDIVLENDEERAVAKSLYEKLSEITEKDWKKDVLFPVFKQVMDEKKVRMPILYKVLTGKERGLPLPETIEILKKNKALERLQKNI